MIVTYLDGHVSHIIGIQGQPGEGCQNLQSDINFSDSLAKVEWLFWFLGEVRFCPVKCFKKGLDVALIGLSRGGEARLVDAIVDQVILPLMGLVNLLPQILRVQLNVTVLFVDKVIKLVCGQIKPRARHPRVNSPPRCLSCAESRCSRC